MTPSRLLLLAGFIAVTAMAPRLQAAGLAGRILELNTGVPVADARVSLLPLSKGTRAGTRADAKGEFHFDAVTPGRYRIDVSKPGYAASAMTVACDGDSTVLIRVAKAGRIRGKVTTADGEPAQGARVFALARKSGWAESTERTDDQGRYDLSGLPLGEYAIGVSYSGEGTAAGATAALVGMAAPRAFSIVSGEHYDDADVALPPGEACSLDGRVDPQPAKGPVLVTLALHDEPAIPVTQAVTDGEGRFRMEMVHPGHYDVLAIGPTDARLNGGMGGLLVGDTFFGRAEVNLTCQGDMNVAVSMQPGGKAAFRLNQAAPCAKTGRMHLGAVEAWGARLDQDVEVSTDVMKTVSALAPSRYRIALSDLPNNCFYLGGPNLDFSTGVPETIPLKQSQAAEIDGHVQIAPPGTSAEYVVLLRPEMPAEGGPALWICKTDKQGHFAVESLRPGNYSMLTASAAEWSSPEWKLEPSRMVPVQLAVGRTDMDVPAPAPQTR